jgi:hypothetical protein
MLADAFLQFAEASVFLDLPDPPFVKGNWTIAEFVVRNALIAW